MLSWSATESSVRPGSSSSSDATSSRHQKMSRRAGGRPWCPSRQVSVRWSYRKENDRALEMIEEFKEEVTLPFFIVGVD